MGHMNVQFYASKFDDATWQLFNKINITSSYIKNNNKGMVAVDQHISYFKELLPGDTIYIASQVIEIKSKTIKFKHQMINCQANEISAETEILGVHIDTKKRKSCTIPNHVQMAVQELC